MLLIDGSYGEGGGQILRTSLTMSLLTSTPFMINNIRIKRKNPGLAPQHLTSIEAVQKISESKVDGAFLKSKEIRFYPTSYKEGEYSFSVGTAGSMTLVLHAIYIPLSLREEPSKLDFYGGTHVNWAPIFEYLDLVWNKVISKLNFDINLKLHKAGYYPKGGGHYTAYIFPIKEIKPLKELERGKVKKVKIIITLSNMSNEIAQKEIELIEKGLETFLKKNNITKLEKEIKVYPSIGKGNAIFLYIEFKSIVAGFSKLIEKGNENKVEEIIQDLLEDFYNYIESNALVDKYLADQLLLPLSLAKGVSKFSVSKITNHLYTNAKIIKKFTNTTIKIEGNIEEPGIVEIDPYTSNLQIILKKRV